jgi:asparagine synthase (glutamine-hydrolysing)
MMPIDPVPALDDVLLTRDGWVRHGTRGVVLLALAPRLREEETAGILRGATSAEDALRTLEELGESAVIAIAADGEMHLLTDVNRSFPLFWRSHRSGWIVSDDVRVLAGRVTTTADQDSVRQFAAGGLVLGEATLYAGVHRTPPDATVHLPASADPEAVIVRRHGRIALPEDGPVVDVHEAGSVFREVLLEGVGALVARNPDATFLLPLSGGADSRLLGAAFVIAGARDVRSFTYGVTETAEVSVSRRVAELLGIPWTFVEMPPEKVRAAWQDRTNARFLADTYTGAALPHVQDWYALRQLDADPRIPADAIVVPGHTAVRTLKDADLVDAEGVAHEELVEAIVLRHFSQAGRPRELLQDPVLRARIEETLLRAGEDGSPLGRARALQAVNIDGRQSTYILNSVRSYESFGLGWAMPMLDAPLHRVMSTLHWRLTRDRAWYQSMTDEVFTGVVGGSASDLSFWAPTAIPVDRRRRMKESLRRLGLLRLAEHAASSRTNLRHPMAFEAFAPDRREYAVRIARGESPQGVWSRAFLEGRWNRWMDWREPATWSTPEVTAVSGPTDG